ncbi:MAG: hypothetical protein AAGU21_04020 [Solidesulfovibrio sp.]|uniref:hypothetical protein n=1 Tax=Solidesulfovibrio sp. TaxID=2910990 RepID=UPI002B2145CD|nr:hypothetical protein [Solidesulfovibrio sp.]MEA4856457.1 hypothetical protein [Solidesulfovibrio sp.]
MLDQLAQMDMSIYFQTVVFLLFIGLLLRLHWKMGSFTHILTNALRYGVLLLVFIYLFLNWASDVNPSLRNSSILIMTLINIYLLWHVIVAAVELPYRRALASCVDGICTSTDLEQAFSTGKRFYKLRYFWASLSSGSAPWRFLRGIAAERTRDDLHRVFVSLDPKASLFGASLYAHFLQNQLDADRNQPLEKRTERQRFVEALDKDAWLTEKTGEFLHQLLAAPEELQERGLKAALKDAGKMA